MTTCRIHPLMCITMHVLQIMTSSLAGEGPPSGLLILNPASAHCPSAFLTVKATFEVRFFFLKPPKEVGVNRNLLSLWDISFQGKLRWMTGTPASPVEPVIGPKTQRWVDRDLKGLIRCCVGAIPSCRFAWKSKRFSQRPEQTKILVRSFCSCKSHDWKQGRNYTKIKNNNKKNPFLYQLSNFGTFRGNTNECHYARMRKIVTSPHS